MQFRIVNDLFVSFSIPKGNSFGSRSHIDGSRCRRVRPSLSSLLTYPRTYFRNRLRAQ
jgi:hypothetical protein